MKYNRDKYKNNLIQFMHTEVYKNRGYADYKDAKAQSAEEARKNAVKQYFIDEFAPAEEE